MARNYIEFTLSNEGTRNEVRMRVVNRLSEESPGTGNGDGASRYIYFVETLDSGDRIYLKRPANLHNGFDFLVCVENANYAEPGCYARNYPKHEDIAADLENKKAQNPAEYKRLYALMRRVFECHDVSDDEMRGFTFEGGLSVDHILKAMKWLFIEQDIRYWNYSGRNMMWRFVPPAE